MRTTDVPTMGHFYTLFLHSCSGIALCKVMPDANGEPANYKYVEVNEAFERIIERSGDIVDRTILDIFPNQDGSWLKKCSDTLRTGESSEFEVYSNDLAKWLMVRCYKSDSEHIVTVINDITERKKNEEAFEKSKDQLKENEQFLQSILDNAPVGIWLTDPWGKRLLMNKHYRESTGAGRHTPTITPEESRNCRITDQKTLMSNRPQEFEEVLTFADGEQHTLRTIKTVLRKDNGEVIGTLGIGVDITELKKAEKELRYMTFHDSLTGLYNRRFFEEEMHRLDTPRQLPISIIMADLDGLKLVNDSLGHHEGDRLLAIFADTLRKACRSEDIIARWAGDEFVILLPRTTHQQAQAIIDRIVQFSKAAQGAAIPVNASLGSASKAEPTQDMLDVFREAENQMYTQKTLNAKHTADTFTASLYKVLLQRSQETEQHIFNLQLLGGKLGEKLGLGERELAEVDMLAVLHDIGKVKIPEAILQKKSEFTPRESDIIKSHAETGYRIAMVTSQLYPIAEAILAHHENWDGSGYPKGLKGEEIPLVARILAVVNRFDVLIHGRRNQPAVSVIAALRDLKTGAGVLYDPRIVDAFIELVRTTDITSELKDSFATVDTKTAVRG